MIKLPEWIKKTDILHASENQVEMKGSLIEETKLYLKAIWGRMVDWQLYPRDYINFYESQGQLTLFHFQNNLLINRQEISLDDLEWFSYVRSRANTPIYLVLQGHDCEFRSFLTRQINFWDRFFLFSQMKANEFAVGDLLTHYQPKNCFEKVDVLAVIRGTDRLKRIYEVLTALKVPIGGVVSWDIEQGVAMKNQVRITHSLRHWVVTLVPLDGHRFTMVVMCQDTILLQRIVNSKTTSDIEKELRSTLRFLQRQGYQEGQAVSVLVLEDTIRVDEFSQAEFEAIAVPKRLFVREAYKPTKGFLNFKTDSLTQANLAYQFPRLAIKFLVPLGVILLILWSSVQIKSFFQDYEYKWLKSNYEKALSKTTSDFAEQAHLSKLFMGYVIAGDSNPSEIMRNVSKLLKGKAQAVEVTWAPLKNGTELRLQFAKMTRAKNQEFKKYIEQNCEKFLGDVNVTWGEQANETILLIIQHKTGRNAN